MFLPTSTSPGRTRRRPWATWSIAALCVVMFLVELRVENAQRLVELLGLVPAHVGRFPDGFHGVITHAFLHGGWAHLLGNLWFLLVFGVHAEARLGSRETLALFLWCAVAGGLVHAASARGSTVPLVGASGAISGLMGASWWLDPGGRMGAWLILTVHVRVWMFVGAWAAWQVVQAFGALGDGAARGGVAFFAHVGGLAAGLAVAAVSRAAGGASSPGAAPRKARKRRA